MPEWALQLVESLGPIGFIMFLVWNFQHKTIPRLASENRAAQEQQRQDFRGMFSQQRDDFERILNREQEVHAEQTQVIVDAVKDLARDVRDAG